MDDTNYIAELHDRIRSGTITESEWEAFSALLEKGESKDLLDNSLLMYWNNAESQSPLPEIVQEKIPAAICAKFPHNQEKNSRIKSSGRTIVPAAWFRWAAVLLLTLGTGTYIFFHTSQSNQEVAQVTPSPTLNDVLPGTNKAILTLSNGQQVQLTKAGIAETINDGPISIQNNDGELNYRNADVMAMNRMTTPKGGQYQLTLSDGTRVWLNAASSITFPTAFKGAKREVSVTGEVYFEVAKDKSKPFMVTAKQQVINVIGTSFNINAYDDEASIKTTLIEGAVNIKDIILKPGQAYFGNKIIAANTKQDIAWKNGRFDFNRVKIQDAMRQLARWYDIEVRYPNGIPDIEFGGSLPRDLSLAQVLEGLKNADINFEINNRILTIAP